MLGAIIGDIVGSHYEVEEIKAIKYNPTKKREYEERIKILSKDTPLFTANCLYTDDTVLTIAIANALIEPSSFNDSLKRFGNEEISLGVDKYGRSRFGSGFVSWLKGEKEGDSYGNGAAMRISPIAYYYDDLDLILTKSHAATIPSHNNQEAIEGAQAVTTAIYLAKNNCSKAEIKSYLEKEFSYQLDFDLENLQRNYIFSSRSSSSVPQAIFCFLESTSFEDCLRKSISIGGDTDTIAAIACSIAESFYGIPENLKEQALTYLPERYQKIVANFYRIIGLKKDLQDLEICNESFWNYMQPRTKRINYPLNSGIWGTFTDNPNTNGNSEIRILVPPLTTELGYKINIHEYAHAYELFILLQNNENFDKIDKQASEEFAKSKEKEYELKKVL